MKLIDTNQWQEIYSTLRKNKLRTFLTAFGVAWGIFMLMILMGAGNGLRNGVTGTFQGQTLNNGAIWPGQTTIAANGFPIGRRWSLHIEDVEALKQNVDGIDLALPEVHSWVMNISNRVEYKEKNGMYDFEGIYPESISKFNPVRIIQGRHMNYLDIRKKSKVMVIGKTVRSELFEKDEDPIGKYVIFNHNAYKIIGVFESMRQGNRAMRQDKAIYMPVSIVNAIYNFGDIVHGIAITTKKGYSFNEVLDDSRRFLSRKYGFAVEDTRALNFWSTEMRSAQMRGLFKGINILLLIVGTGTLISGIIGVSNIMLFVVKERTKEIGIYRAIGATPYIIIKQIITESLALTFVAGYMGMAFGFLVIEGVNKMLKAAPEQGNFFANPEVSLNTTIMALVILVIAGTLAGLIPATKAINIKPVDAIRTEI